MKVVLTPEEARVIGCLMEKEVTTPDQYPLSINSLTTACNQKSNRDPLMDLEEARVQAVVDALMKRHLVSDRSGFGGRVPKYKQVFCNTQLGPLQFPPVERAIVCELLLRGPQSPGELRTRCQRMARIAEVGEIEAALERLAAHPDGPFVARQPRAPGMRETRWAHLLGGEVAAEAGIDQPPLPVPESRSGIGERLAALESEVARLRAELEELKRRAP